MAMGKRVCAHHAIWNVFAFPLDQKVNIKLELKLQNKPEIFSNGQKETSFGRFKAAQVFPLDPTITNLPGGRLVLFGGTVSPSSTVIKQ